MVLYFFRFVPGGFLTLVKFRRPTSATGMSQVEVAVVAAIARDSEQIMGVLDLSGCSAANLFRC